MAFLRDDLAQLAAYQSPHPASHSGDSADHSDEDEATSAANQPTSGSLETKLVDPLDTNESPIDLPASLKTTLAQTYQQRIAANRYPDGSCWSLKQAVASYAASSGEIAPDEITPENITLGNGSDELIRSIIMATCLGSHGSILVSEPTFSMYAILAKTLGVSVHRVGRKDNFEVNLAAADSAIEAAKKAGPPVRVVFMVHPNSPTANALTQLELDWLKQLPSDILVVVDEAYFEFSGHTTLTEALVRPNWIVTRTFSKAFRLAAHRVGYGIAQPHIIAALEKLRLPYNLPSFSQAAAEAALAHSDELLTQIPTLVAERNQLFQALLDHEYLRVWPSDSNFLYVRLSDRGLKALSANSQEEGLAQLFQSLRSKGTLIRHTGGGLRISIGTSTENQRTLANLNEVLSKTTAASNL